MSNSSSSNSNKGNNSNNSSSTNGHIGKSTMSLMVKVKEALWDSTIHTNSSNNLTPLGRQRTGHGLLALMKPQDETTHLQRPTR
jgi:hypothetical protein